MVGIGLICRHASCCPGVDLLRARAFRTGPGTIRAVTAPEARQAMVTRRACPAGEARHAAISATVAKASVAAPPGGESVDRRAIDVQPARAPRVPGPSRKRFSSRSWPNVMVSCAGTRMISRRSSPKAARDTGVVTVHPAARNAIPVRMPAGESRTARGVMASAMRCPSCMLSRDKGQDRAIPALIGVATPASDARSARVLRRLAAR